MNLSTLVYNIALKISLNASRADDRSRTLFESERGGVGKITSVRETNDLLAAAKNAARAFVRA